MGIGIKIINSLIGGAYYFFPKEKNINGEMPTYSLMIHEYDSTENLNDKNDEEINKYPSETIKTFSEKDKLLNFLATKINKKRIRTLDLTEENKLRFIQEKTNPTRYHIWPADSSPKFNFWKYYPHN